MDRSITTVTGPTYEEALRNAKKLYGDNIGVTARRDVVTKGMFGIVKNRECQLTVFIPDTPVQQTLSYQSVQEQEPVQADDDRLLKRFEEEARTPDPATGAPDPGAADFTFQAQVQQPEPSWQENKAEKDADEVLEPYLEHIRAVLLDNDFSPSYGSWICNDIEKQLRAALPAVPTQTELDMLIADRICGSVRIDHDSQANPPKILVALGPTGIGKTTTLAKIGALYSRAASDAIRRKVRIITLDSFRVGAFEQMESFGRSLGIQVTRVSGEGEFSAALANDGGFDITLVDTIGKSPRDNELDRKLRSLIDVASPQSGRKAFLAVSASMKKEDIDSAFDHFSPYGLSGVIVTKVDETATIGNILSICHERNMPLLFITDGQRVPSDIHPATNRYVLSLIRGLSPDALNIFS